MPVPSTAGNSFQVRIPSSLTRGADNALRMEASVNGARVAITGGTFSLYGPTGTAIVDAQNVTVSSGVATYTVLAASLPSTLDMGDGYREVWALTYSGGSAVATRPAILVKYPLICPVTQATIEGAFPAVSDLMRGNTTHLQGFIDQAWVDAVNRLLAAGVIPEHIVDVNQIEKPVRAAALANLFRFFSVTQPQVERWPQLVDSFTREAEASWAVYLRSRLDTDQDGVADSSERTNVGGVLRTNGSAAPAYTTSPWVASGHGAWRRL